MGIVAPRVSLRQQLDMKYANRIWVQYVGTIPISKLPGGDAIRVVVHGSRGIDDLAGNAEQDNAPRVFFSDFQLSELAEAEQAG